MLVAINLARPCIHVPSKQTIQYQVVPHHLQKVTGTVKEFLCICDNFDPLFKYTSYFFFGRAVLSHFYQDLDFHCALLNLCRFR